MVCPILPQPMTLRAKFFGKFHLHYGDTVIDSIKSQKSLELLAYLLFERDVHSRDAVAGLIWGHEISTEQARKYLRNTLWQLQKDLDRQIPGDVAILDVQPRTVSVNPSRPVWTDVRTFESAYELVRDRSGAMLTEKQADDLRRAMELYNGPFLDGWYSDWCLIQRERSKHLALLMLDKLMEFATERGEYEEGIAYGERILHFDRAREVTHRNLMVLYYLSGDRSSALRQYQLCEEVLREELDIEPSELTRDVLESIRNESLRRPGTGDEARLGT